MVDGHRLLEKLPDRIFRGIHHRYHHGHYYIQHYYRSTMVDDFGLPLFGISNAPPSAASFFALVQQQILATTTH